MDAAMVALLVAFLPALPWLLVAMASWPTSIEYNSGRALASHGPHVQLGQILAAQETEVAAHAAEVAAQVDAQVEDS